MGKYYIYFAFYTPAEGISVRIARVAGQLAMGADAVPSFWGADGRCRACRKFTGCRERQMLTEVSRVLVYHNKNRDFLT